MESETPETRFGLRRHVEDRLPAFIATLVGGAVAMFVNAPLTSPDDLVGNAGSVGAGSLIAALMAGMVWARISGDVQKRARVFNILITVALLLVVVAAAGIEFVGEISNTIRYVIPLAAVVTIFASVFTPLIERWKTQTVLLLIAAALPLAMMAAGYFLTVNEFGFTDAPSLSLPPPPKSS
jgi:hypothetical protein